MENAHVFKDLAIDEVKHAKYLQFSSQESEGNPMPKGVVTLEKLYDLQNRFKGPFNTNTHNSTLSHEKVNIGKREDPKFVNLDACCTPQEWYAFIHLFKQYQDVFSWTYDNIKTYDT